MIENLIVYLGTQFPAYTFVQSLDVTDSQNTILVRPTGGPSQGATNLNRVDATVQIVSGSQDRFVAREQIMKVYEFLQENFDFNLPAVPELSLPAINVAKVSANQFPGDFSLADSGVYTYLCNFTLVFSNKTS